MSQVIEVKIPDIGDFKNVPVIEVLVKPGDAVGKEDPLVSLESDKATMEVPSPAAGVVKELKVKVGDKVSEGSAVLTLDAADGAGATPPPAESKPAESRPSAPPPKAEAKAPAAAGPGEGGSPAVPGGERSAAQPRRAVARREERGRRRLRARAREPGGAPFRARAGRRPRRGSRAPAPASASSRRTCRTTSRRSSRVRAAPKAAAWGSTCRRSAGGFREVRPGGDEAALAHQEALGRVPAPQLGNDSARHATRRGGYHRARGVSQGAGRGGEEERHQVHDARLPPEGVGGGAAGSFPISMRRCRPMARA